MRKAKVPLDIRCTCGNVAGVDRKRKVPKEMPMSIRLDVETYEAFRRIAESEHRTMAGELRRLIEAHIARYDQKEAA